MFPAARHAVHPVNPFRRVACALERIPTSAATRTATGPLTTGHANAEGRHPVMPRPTPAGQYVPRVQGAQPRDALPVPRCPAAASWPRHGDHCEPPAASSGAIIGHRRAVRVACRCGRPPCTRPRDFPAAVGGGPVRQGAAGRSVRSAGCRVCGARIIPKRGECDSSGLFPDAGWI